MRKSKSLLVRFIDFLFIDKNTKISQYEEPESILKTQILYSSLSLQFLIILSAATLISSLGLMADSSVTIVGAMLIAPLMKPIMSFSYATTIGDGTLKLRSIITLAVGIVLTISISYVTEKILTLHIVTTQMASRTEPNLFDLGVAIAAGTAAALAMSRKSIADTLPGVAIAVALVPPLCVAGISFSMGVMHAFYGSLLLFAVNLFAIIISAVIVFLVTGYGAIKHTLLTVAFLVIVIFLMVMPLKQSLDLIKKDDIAQTVVEEWLYQNYPKNVDIHPADLSDIAVIDNTDHIFVYVELKSPGNGLNEMQLSHIHDRLEKIFKKPVNLKIQLLITQELVKNSKKRSDGTDFIYGKDFMVPRR